MDFNLKYIKTQLIKKQLNYGYKKTLINIFHIAIVLRDSMKHQFLAKNLS